MNSKINKLFLILIITLAIGLRFYKIGEVPPSISWDEAAVGYNGWTIANFGKDEYGKPFPIFFRSFADDKHPVHIYSTAFFVKILGLNEESIRIPSAVFGVLNVLLIFLLAKLLFKNNLIASISALFLSISPYNIHFSRFNHEANFVLFFFMLGLILFYLSLKKSIYLPYCVLFFGISFVTYHSAKIAVPIIFIFLTALYIRKIKIDRNFLAAIFIGIVFISLLISNSQLLGFARINQTAQGIADVEETRWYQNTHNIFLGRLNLMLTQYFWHFSPQYLFIQGDKNSRLSSQTGEFYKLDLLFLILGTIYLIHRRTKEGIVVLIWALVAPLPSALVAEAPHAARASFMMGSWHLISAVGFYSLINFFNKRLLIKRTIVALSLVVLTISLISYLNYYYNEFAKRYAIDWQYGMKQIVQYVKTHPEYTEVFMTDVRSQPYIFFLFYLKVPLPEYLNSVIYNNSESKSYNTVSYFDRYYFGGADPVESLPNDRALYIITPSQYDGLRYKLLFEVKQIVYYPNDTTAFYLVSKKI